MLLEIDIPVTKEVKPSNPDRGVRESLFDIEIYPMLDKFSRPVKSGRELLLSMEKLKTCVKLSNPDKDVRDILSSILSPS